MSIYVFFQIPFPPWDIFRLFPSDDEVLQGLLACDLVAFHINDYCLNFIDCCERRLGCRVDRKSMLVEHGGRTVSSFNKISPVISHRLCSSVFIHFRFEFVRFQLVFLMTTSLNWLRMHRKCSPQVVKS